MEKPIEIKIEELKNKLIQEINSSKLPPFVVEPIIKEIYNQIEEIRKQELAKAQKEYNESQVNKEEEHG